MSKVYFIGSRYESCFYVRCFVPMVAGGWDGYRVSMNQPQASNKQIAEGIQNSDVIVFQRPMYDEHLILLDLCKSLGKKVVFDNDDTYKPNSGKPTQARNSKEKETLDRYNKNIHTFIKEADLVTTSTEFLANEYREINDKVVVLPNMIEPFDWPQPNIRNNKKLRVGIFGSTTANNDYLAIKPLLDELNKRDDIQLVVQGMVANAITNPKLKNGYKEELDFWSQYDIEAHPAVAIGYYFEALNDLELDIALIPREESDFNRAKSNLKFLESSMLQIPVIAQGFTDGQSPYQGKDEPYLKICSSIDEWFDAFAELENKKNRTDLAKSAYQYVLDNYNINDHIKLWEKTYDGKEIYI